MEYAAKISDVLAALHSDLNRIQTVAGTLSQVDSQHYRELTKFDNERLSDIAVAEQNSARQLGEIKQLCIGMARQIEELRESIARD